MVGFQKTGIYFQGNQQNFMILIKKSGLLNGSKKRLMINKSNGNK